MAQERVQKILARAGIASRRKAEELILEGAVTINGVTAKLGDQAEWGKDSIKVNGQLLTATEQPVYIAFHKPKNVICAMNDPQGRPALADYFVRVKARIYPVGKLDFGTEGIVLLTNDGEMAQKITTSKEVVQVYSVKVRGAPDAEMLKRISRGMRTEQGHLIKPEVVRVEEKLQAKTKLQLVMRGTGGAGLKELFETRGFTVDRMVREAMGQIRIGDLEPGKYRRLEASQIRAIFENPELGLRTVKKALEADAERAERRARDDKTRIERQTRGTGVITPRGAGPRPRKPARSSGPVPKPRPSRPRG